MSLPEKLVAKLILASSKHGDVVMDPFLGSGTTAAAASKLDRQFLGIEIDRTYSLLSLKRVALAATDKTIQGYADGVFWERNTLAEQLRVTGVRPGNTDRPHPAQSLLLGVA